MDKHVAALVDNIIAHVTENRPRPDYDAEETVRGNLAAMKRLQLLRLAERIGNGKSIEIRALILRQLYGSELHVVEQKAA